MKEVIKWIDVNVPKNVWITFLVMVIIGTSFMLWGMFVPADFSYYNGLIAHQFWIKINVNQYIAEWRFEGSNINLYSAYSQLRYAINFEEMNSNPLPWGYHVLLRRMQDAIIGSIILMSTLPICIAITFRNYFSDKRNNGESDEIKN